MHKLGLHNHGEERVQRIYFHNGKTVYFKREKFCVEHGWIDLFLFPDWTGRHNRCGVTPDSEKTGAFLDLPEDTPKRMAATA